MIGLDTNVLLRHLIQDDAVQSDLATEFIAQSIHESTPLWISKIVLVEIVWVLQNVYKLEDKQIRNVLEKVMLTNDFVIEDFNSCWQALNEYHLGFDFADALINWGNHNSGCIETVTFDKQASKLSNTTLLS